VLKDFYLAFSAVCFTLLGLWLIVVQTRHAEWRRSELARRRAYGVALHFSLPGQPGGIPGHLAAEGGHGPPAPQ